MIYQWGDRYKETDSAVYGCKIYYFPLSPCRALGCQKGKCIWLDTLRIGYLCPLAKHSFMQKGTSQTYTLKYCTGKVMENMSIFFTPDAAKLQNFE